MDARAKSRRLPLVIGACVAATVAFSAPALAQDDVTQADCDALREANEDSLAQQCLEELAQQEQPQLEEQGSQNQGSQNQGSTEGSTSGTTPQSRPRADTVGLSRTGFPLWPLALAGIACVGAGFVLLRRRSDHLSR